MSDTENAVDQYRKIAQLVGGLAHEIKNPLSTIRLNMELLAEDFEEPETPRDRRALSKVQLMQRECQRLQNLLDDFLKFARVRRVRLKPGDVNEVVAGVLDFYALEADTSHIEIIRYLDPDLPRVMLDADALHQAVLNLVINAQQAMPDGGQLVVRTTSRGSTVALQLIDTGAGMDERTATQAFDPFFSTKDGGSGLGLATTGQIIEAHGGRITIQSELGRGTQFTIELPVPQRLASSDDKASGERQSPDVAP